MKHAIRLALSLASAAPFLRAAEAPRPTVITSAQFDARSTDTQTVSTFTDNVVVTGTGIRLTCDRLEVVTVKLADKTDTIGRQEQFKRMLATGHVRIVQGDREATCGRAEVLPRDDRITLTEGPVVTDHGNGTVATGEPLELFRDQRIVRGRNVSITLPPIKDLGFDRNQQPPSPTAPPPVPAAPPPPSAPLK